VFGDKTMRGDWQTDVASELVLPRGRWVLDLTATTRASTEVRGAFGIPVPYDDALFRTSTFTIGVETGLSDRTTLYLRAPWVDQHLTNGLGANTRTTALGDAHSGVRFQPWLGRAHALAFELDIKSPSGLEWPANTTGGDAHTEGFLTGTGTTNASLATLGRLRAGDAFAFDGRVAYTHKFAGVVGYVVEIGGFGDGWLKPGDEFRGDLAVTEQLDEHVSVRLSSTARYVGTYRVGVSGPGVTKLELYALSSEEQYTYDDGTVGTIATDPSGWFIDAAAHVQVTPSKHVVLGADASASMLGADGRFFTHLGLEEFSPAPGLTLGASGAVRW
jgi:hypothetical protein